MARGIGPKECFILYLTIIWVQVNYISFSKMHRVSDRRFGDSDSPAGILYLPHDLRREKKCRIVLGIYY